MITTENNQDYKFGQTSERPANCETHGEYTERGIAMLRNRVTWTGCAKCNEIAAKKRDQEEEIAKQQVEQERMERKFKQAGIPLRFREKTLNNFVADTDKKVKALKIATDFVNNFDANFASGMTIIFSGKAGTGKSHLAIAIAHEVMPAYTALYINALDAVRMVRDTWRKDSEKSELQVLDMLGSLGLLIIDEVGVQYGTESEQMIMFDIINRRYRDCKPMILLTNLDANGFAEYLTERSADRLKENGKWVTFDWESYRGKKAE